MDTPQVVVECDRCHRPAGVLGMVNTATGQQVVAVPNGQAALLAFPQFSPSLLAVELPELPRGHRYAVSSPPPDGSALERYTFACVGRTPWIRGRQRQHPRQHPRCQVTVTAETATSAYQTAVAAGRERISMYELRTARSGTALARPRERPRRNGA